MFNNIPPSGFPQIDLSQDVKRINAEISSMTSDCSTILTDITAETVTVSGNPITLSDALATDAISVVAEIEPSQDLHGYDRPWSGGSGKNKLNPSIASSTVNDVEITKNSDGSYTLNGTASAAVMLYFETFETGGASYILSGCPSGGSYTTYCMGVVDHGTDYGNGLTFNEDERPYIRVANGYHVDHMTFYPMIRLASVTDVTFEPYSNICPVSGMTEVNVSTTDGTDTNTATASLGTTVYGGSVDVTEGSASVEYGYITINDVISDRTTSYSNPVFYGSINGLKPQTNNILSECFNVIAGKPSAQSFADNSNNGDFAINSVNTGNAIQVFLRCDDYTDVTSLKNALGTQAIAYELATPTTLSFTSDDLSMLDGENTISTDAEEVSVEYIKNTLVGRVRRLEEEQ